MSIKSEQFQVLLDDVRRAVGIEAHRAACLAVETYVDGYVNDKMLEAQRTLMRGQIKALTDQERYLGEVIEGSDSEIMLDFDDMPVADLAEQDVDARLIKLLVDQCESTKFELLLGGMNFETLCEDGEPPLIVLTSVIEEEFDVSLDAIGEETVETLSTIIAEKLKPCGSNKGENNE